MWERGDVPCSNSAFLACNPRNAARSQNRRWWRRLPLAHDVGEGGRGVRALGCFFSNCLLSSKGIRKIGMTLYGRPHRSTEPRGLDSLSKRFPCRDRTVPATRACRARQHLRRTAPWLGQSCPSVSLAGTGLSLLRGLAGTRQHLRRTAPWLGQSVQAFPLQGQDCPCYEGLQGKTAPATRFFEHPSFLLTTHL
ncbi:MAG: hypothetical protein KatS3mg019_2344 [Fimbriimonadales bacterium]|nr:MAG: hypothetical protein KatS3mg019_2344 [Fimbriimonadales bacterium]